MKKRIKFSRVYNYTRTKKLRQNGTAAVYVRAYLNGKNKYFNTGICVSPNQWDGKNQRIVKHPDQVNLNFDLSELEKKLGLLESNLIHQYGYATLDRMDDSQTVERDVSFTQFYKNRLDEQTNAAVTTSDQKQTYDKLVEFRKQIYFNEIDYKLVDQFDKFLSKSLHVNTVAKHHKNLKKYIRLAIAYKILKPGDNPYLSFTIKKTPTSRLFLTESELDVLEKVKLKNETFRIMLDFYLFMCWTGLRFIDASRLVATDFTKTKDGIELFFTSKKTNKPHRLKLRKLFNGKPERLIQRYLEKYDEIYYDDPDNPVPLFFDYTNQAVNRNLKTIVKKIAIRERAKLEICCHSGRHTFGTILAGKVPIHILMNLMQHSKLSQTMIYVHLNQTMVSKALDDAKW